MPTPNIEMEYPEESERYDAEKQLAMSIIAITQQDYARATRGMAIEKDGYRLELVKDECFKFLTGQTEIADHWFTVAGMRFFTSSELEAANDNMQMAARLTKKRSKITESKQISLTVRIEQYIADNAKAVISIPKKKRVSVLLQRLNKHFGKTVSEMTVRRAIGNVFC